MRNHWYYDAKSEVSARRRRETLHMYAALTALVFIVAWLAFL